MLTSAGLLLAVAVMLVRGGLRREYRSFFAYLVFTLLNTMVRLSVIGNYRMYFYEYWYTEPVSAVLMLLALHEAFQEVFKAFYLFWWFRMIFPTVVAIIAFFSIRRAFVKPLSMAPRFMSVIFSIDSGLTYIQVGVFVVFMFLVMALHVRWRRYPYDITLGFAVAAMGEWTSYLLRSEFWSAKYARAARYAPSFTYLLASVIWLWSFSRKREPEPRLEWRDEVTPEQLLQEVRQYVRIMKRGMGGQDKGS